MTENAESDDDEYNPIKGFFTIADAIGILPKPVSKVLDVVL